MDELNESAKTNEVTQDANEVAETSIEQQNTETKVEETEVKVEQKQQSKEDNSRFARERREREEKDRLEKAKDEARTQAIIDAIGENPYTHKPLEDAKDVETYLIMKQIDKDGGDPLGDYPEYQKKSEKKKEESSKASADAEQKRINDIKDFVSKYPNVNLDKLGEDADFEEYIGSRLGEVPLAELYKNYLSLKERLISNKENSDKDKAIREQAKNNASVGSLDSVQARDGLYTIEELKQLSMAEIEKNWDKVQKSRAKYKI